MFICICEKLLIWNLITKEILTTVINVHKLTVVSLHMPLQIGGCITALVIALRTVFTLHVSCSTYHISRTHAKDTHNHSLAHG